MKKFVGALIEWFIFFAVIGIVIKFIGFAFNTGVAITGVGFQLLFRGIKLMMGGWF